MTTGRIDVLAFLKALDGNTCSLELNAKAFHAHAAVAELIEFAESALSYVDAAADAERARHKASGAPNSQVLAKTVADALRASLSRCGARP